MRMSPRCRAAMLVIGAMLLAGCAAGPGGATTDPYRVAQHFDGAYGRTIVAGRYWYQTQGRHVHISEARSGALIGSAVVGRIGRDGAAIDMDQAGSRLWIVLDGTSVVEVDAQSPEEPRLVKRWTAEELGIEPHHVRRVDGRIFVSGRGGVVELISNQRFSAGEHGSSEVSTYGPVAVTAHGPAAAVGRQLRTLRDHRYLGAAHELIALENGRSPEIDANVARWVYVLRGEAHGEIGLMSHSIRSVDRMTLDASIRSVRHRRDRVWVVTPNAVVACVIDNDELIERDRYELSGVHDVDQIDEHTLAVAGTFGRGIYHTRDDRLFVINRPPTGLKVGSFDGRQVVVGDGDRDWRLRLGGTLERVFEQTVAGSGARRQAESLRFRATIDEEDPERIVLTGAFGERILHAPETAAAHTLAAASDRLWVGHDLGVDVHRIDRDGGVKRIQSLRLPGAVHQLFPLLRRDGVVYVSPDGGLGLIERVEEP